MISVALKLGWAASQIAVANGIASIALFLTSIVVSKLGGPSQLGEYGLIIAIGALLGGIVDLGSDRVLVQRVAETSVDWRSAWRAVLWLKGGGVTAAGLASLVYFFFSGNLLPLLAVFYALSVTAWLTIQGLASTIQRVRLYSVLRAAGRGAGVIALLVFAWLGYLSHPAALAAVLVSAADVVAGAAIWVVALQPYFRRLRLAPVNRASTLKAVRQSFPLGISSIATWIYVKIDTILLGLLTNLPTVGAYTAAVRLAELLGGLSTAIYTVLLPAFARSSTSDTDDLWRRRNLAVVAVMIAIGFLCLGVFCFANVILEVTFRIAASISYLQILAWGQIYAAAGVISYAILQVRRAQGTIAAISIATSLLSIPLYVALILIWGATGAAIGTVVSYALIVPAGLMLTASRSVFRIVLRASFVVVPSALAGIGIFEVLGGTRAAHLLHALLALSGYCLITFITIRFFSRGASLALSGALAD
ncbi:MAG TPA: oligosaccharide flippase family protein [Candidatus Dormibacteraeota bacterium]